MHAGFADGDDPDDEYGSNMAQPRYVERSAAIP
jgi:hypothetical protein